MHNIIEKNGDIETKTGMERTSIRTKVKEHNDQEMAQSERKIPTPKTEVEKCNNTQETYRKPSGRL